MVNVLIAPDKFKGSLTAREVCNAISSSLPPGKFSVKEVPLADGGEGTFDVLLDHYRGEVVEKIVYDPLLRKIKASYGLSNDGATAFIEMARASGLQLLKNDERNPLITSTFGTGELILDALQKGARQIILGIGGSATNDAGVGMASALGFTFYHGDQRINPVGGGSLHLITGIEDHVITSLSSANFVTLCDVTNPFTGRNGASHIFAAQKGASATLIDTLEDNMRSFERLLLEEYNFDSNFPGAGAAGGLGAGAKFFLRAEMVNGMSYLSAITRLDDLIREADVVITGEGKLDKQSLSGKVVGYVSEQCKRFGKKLIVVCGLCELDPAEVRTLGINECIILSKGVDKHYAISHAADLLKERIGNSRLLSQL